MFKIKVALEETRRFHSLYSVLYLSSDPNVLATYTHVDSEESNSINMLEIANEDFRQILPVISKGTRQDIVHATINASYP